MGDTEAVDKARENRVRRQARRLGLALQKSRARFLHVDDYGLYRIIDPNLNAIMWGEKFDLTLDDVEGYLNETEKQMRAGAGR